MEGPRGSTRCVVMCVSTALRESSGAPRICPVCTEVYTSKGSVCPACREWTRRNRMSIRPPYSVCSICGNLFAVHGNNFKVCSHTCVPPRKPVPEMSFRPDDELDIKDPNTGRSRRSIERIPMRIQFGEVVTEDRESLFGSPLLRAFTTSHQDVLTDPEVDEALDMSIGEWGDRDDSKRTYRANRAWLRE